MCDINWGRTVVTLSLFRVRGLQWCFGGGCYSISIRIKVSKRTICCYQKEHQLSKTSSLMVFLHTWLCVVQLHWTWYLNFLFDGAPSSLTASVANTFQQRCWTKMAKKSGKIEKSWLLCWYLSQYYCSFNYFLIQNGFFFKSRSL